MKLKKHLTGFLICLSFSSGLMSQISYGSQFTNIIYLNGIKVHGYGIGVSYYKAFIPKLILGSNANVYFGGRQKAQDTLISQWYNSTSIPYVDVTRKVFSFTGTFDLRYYIIGDAEGFMSLYGLGGVGFYVGKIMTKTIGTVDTHQFKYPNEQVGDEAGVLGVVTNLGVGFEKYIGNNYLFINTRYNYLTNSLFMNGARYFSPKSFVTIELGLRVPFQKNYTKVIL